MTTDLTTEMEVEGNNVLVMLADETGTDTERTALALAEKDDMSIPVDEDTDEFTPGRTRRTRRYRTAETIDVEVSSAIGVDAEALQEVGIAKEVDDGIQYTSDSSDRRIGYDEEVYAEVAYFVDDINEGNIGELDVVEESELLHRFGQIRTVSPEFDPSETPPMVSWTWWVDGVFYIDYYPDSGDSE